MMHRSFNSVIVRMKRKGHLRRVRDGWYTKKEVCEILGCEHKWLQRRIESGALIASWHSEVKPQKSGGALWEIRDKDLRAFIRKYPEELNGRNVDMIQIVELLCGLDNNHHEEGERGTSNCSEGG